MLSSPMPSCPIEFRSSLLGSRGLGDGANVADFYLISASLSSSQRPHPGSTSPQCRSHTSPIPCPPSYPWCSSEANRQLASIAEQLTDHFLPRCSDLWLALPLPLPSDLPFIHRNRLLLVRIVHPILFVVCRDPRRSRRHVVEDTVVHLWLRGWCGRRTRSGRRRRSRGEGGRVEVHGSCCG